MLRRNPHSGAWERLEGDTWVPAHNVDDAGLDIALEAAFTEVDTSPASDERDAPVPAHGAESPAPQGVVAAPRADAQAPSNGTALVPGTPDDVSAGSGAGPDVGDTSDFARPASGATNVSDIGDWELPGLVSTDTARGVGGQRGLRKKLQDRLHGKREKTSEAGKKIVVGPRSARVSGPAAKEGTAVRQTQRKAKGAQANGEVKPQRYVSKPPPALLGNRPRWMQDLFEAHFRSEMTLHMRREHNRMKISRTDYAIGWLTLMDKLREDPSIARLKKDA